MNREQWQRVRSIFDAVVELDRNERARRLADVEPSVRDEVAALLSSHDAIVDERIEPGTMIDKYEVVSVLGDGGMGSVYLARQREPIQRDVALKVIRDGFITADLLRRFQAERQVLASLSHPYIAAVLDAGVTETNRHYFAMEYVDGVPITDYCRDRKLGRRERLALLEKVFDAIDHAHMQGVIHRDLKPTNVLVTEQDGKVVPKLIDFGIAKSHRTAHTPHTITGQLLGTPSYMSPEQARGRTVDQRTDLWALGCLLYEIETGVPTFPCENVGDTIVAVLSTDPDMTRLPADTPAALRRLLRRCLAKDVERRQASAADARLDLIEARDGPPGASQAVRRSRWALVPWALALLFAAFAFGPRAKTETSPRLARRLQIHAAGVSRREGAAPVLAPDGTRFVFVADQKLWVRRFDSLDASVIAGTDGASYPFWSPDGNTIGYFGNGQLCRVPAAGGEVTRVYELKGSVASGAGACWTQEGQILYSRGNSPLFAISARGGNRRTLYDPPKAHVHAPVAVPNGDILCVVYGLHGANKIAVLAGGDAYLVLDTGSQQIGGIAWAPSGHIVMEQAPVDAGLWAVPYDPKTRVCGAGFRIAPDGGRPSVAQNGALLYVPSMFAESTQLGWVTRDGVWLGNVGAPDRQFLFPRLSPDGARLAVTQRSRGRLDVWIHDLASSTRSRLSFEPNFASLFPVWTPDGETVIGHKSTTDAAGRVDPRIWMRRADGSGKTRSLGAGFLPSVSSDGKFVVFATLAPEIVYTEVHDPTKRKTLVRGQVNVREPVFSPDGALVAYTSNENGVQEIVLTRFPSGDGKWQVTRGGGALLRWSPDGKRIVFVRDNSLYEVSMSRDPIRVSPARLVLAGDPLDLVLAHGFDWRDDRFLVIRELRPQRSEEAAVLVDDWVKASASR